MQPNAARKVKEFNTENGFFGMPIDHEAPIIVCDCMAFIRSRGMYQVGVFRVTGSQDLVGKLKAEYDKEFATPEQKLSNKKSILNTFDPAPTVNDIASLLKAYFKEIPGRLIPSYIIDKMMKTVTDDISEDQKIIQLSWAVKEIPSPNRECLGLMISFLREVCTFKNFNQMGAENLATCFVLSLMGGGDTVNQLQALGYGASVIKALITSPVRLYMPSLTSVQQNTLYTDDGPLAPGSNLSASLKSRSKGTLRSRPRKGTTVSASPTGTLRKGKNGAKAKLRHNKAKKNKAISVAQAFSASDSRKGPEDSNDDEDGVPIPPNGAGSKKAQYDFSGAPNKPDF